MGIALAGRGGGSQAALAAGLTDAARASVAPAVRRRPPAAVRRALSAALGIGCAATAGRPGSGAVVYDLSDAAGIRRVTGRMIGDELAG